MNNCNNPRIPLSKYANDNNYQCYLVSNVKCNDLINMKGNKVEKLYITIYIVDKGSKWNFFLEIYFFSYYDLANWGENEFVTSQLF